MNWADPHWLKLLLVPGAATLLLIAMTIARRRRGMVRWPGIKRVVAAGARVLSVPAGRSVRRPWLLLLSSALVVVALGRPRWGEIEKPVFQRAREVMLALDLSRSMLVKDVAPDRLSRARLLVQSLLDGLRGERMGLIVFSGTAFVQVPLSADYQILNEFLPDLNPDYMPQGGTDYSGMLSAATGGFSDTANTDRYLVILSDGEALDDSWKQQLPELEKRGVRVIALGVGTAAGGFIPDKNDGFVKDERGAVVLSRLESNTLRALAQQTGGIYRDASMWVDLAGLLRETVERGRRGDFIEEKSVEHIERFQWFLAPAVLLAALGIWREIGVRPRPRNVANDRTPAATTRRARPRPAPTTAVGAIRTARAVIGALLLAQALARSSQTSAAGQEQPADPAEEVRQTVTRLAQAPSSSAAGWRELAENTLAYGQSLRQAGTPVEKGPILDAIAAVDEGRRISELEADWTALRTELERLLEDPPEQEKQEDKQDDRNQQQEDENQKKKKKQDQQGSESEDQSGETENQDKQQQGQGDQGSDQDDKQGEQQQQDAQNQQGNSGSDQQREQQQENSPNQPKTPDQPAPEEGRLGDLEKEEPAAEPQEETGEQSSPPPQKQATRKIGGRPADERASPPSDPELAAALQRLRQATDDDSPARLFELLEGKKADQPRTGKDW